MSLRIRRPIRAESTTSRISTVSHSAVIAALICTLGMSRPMKYTTAETRNSTPALRRESRSEEHTSELQSRRDLVCRLLLEKKKKKNRKQTKKQKQKKT